MEDILIGSSQQNQQQNQQEDAGEEEELEDEETSQDYLADNQQNQSTTQTTQTASGGGGGGASVNYCGKTTGTQPLRDKIIINEIAWMGSSISANDEWIELKNITNNLVNLAGWQILDKEKQIKIIFPEGKTIPAGGFYLLERTDNNSVPGISADLIYTGILNDTNEALYLFDSNCQIQDEAVAGPNWLAGNKGERRSMERGSDLDWHTYAGVGINGIMGTPKAENSQTTPATPSPTGQNDITAPQVIFDLSPTQNSLNFTISFEIIDVVTTSIIDGVEETVTPSGLEGFVFHWKEEGGDWQEDVYQEIDGAPTDFSGQKQFTGEDEKTYYFQIKAKDAADNESGWLPEPAATTLIDLPKKVLINEVQTDSKDGSGGTNDDWVELYNPYDWDINLSQWSIQRSPKSGAIYKKHFGEGDKIPAKGYFLIVRNDARQELLDIPADLTSSDLQLSDNSTVYLVKNQEKITGGDDSDIVDKVGFGEPYSFEGSPALNPPKEKSIGRKELGLDTDDNSQDFIVNETISPTNSKNQTLQAITTAVWPVFQYDAQHTGRSNFAGPTIVNNRSVYDLIGIQGSSFTSVLQPVIGFDKTIYFGIKEPDAKLYAMNPDGTKKWEAVLDGWAIAIALGPDNVIYASIRDKGIVAFDSDGAEKWRFYPDGASEVSAAIIGEDGIIYFTDYSNLYCINPDGSQNWLTGNAPRGGGAFGGPAIGLDNTIYVVWTGFRNDIDQDQGQLLAYNSDGAIKWRTPLEFRAGSPIIDSASSIIYVATGASGPLGTTRMVLAFGFDGVEKWRSERESGSFLSALSSDNFLIQADNWSRYVGESGGSAVEQPMSKIKAFDSSGNVAWEIGPESNSSISTQPISDKNGNIYFGETIYEGGGWWFPVIGYKLYSVDRNGAINWSYDVPGEFLSSLAIGDNKNIFAPIAEGTANEKYIKIYSFGE